MDSETLVLLDFEQLLGLVAEFAHCQMGRRWVRSLQPQSDAGRIQHRLDLLIEAGRYLEEAERVSFRVLEDPEPILSALKVDGSLLEPVEILRAASWLRQARQLRRAFAEDLFPELNAEVMRVPSPEPLLAEIERCLDESGQVRDSAHPDLSQVRRRMAQQRRRLKRHLESFLSGEQVRFLISEPYITQRSGRSVLPVRSESKGRIPGIVHGSSSSGATVFVEPLSAVDLNNDYLLECDREAEICKRVLRQLSEQMRAHQEGLRTTIRQVAFVDGVFGSAEFGRSHGCTLPQLSDDGSLRLRLARHPLLIRWLGAEAVVPISLHLSPDENVLVISGPNTGGKTVSLKTVGLLCLMAQSGLPLPAEEASVPLLKNLLADIGDHQSIADHLSTFSAHVGRINDIERQLQAACLVLLDEVGRGTDPVHGAALAIATLEHFRSSGALILATTHQQQVKQYAASAQGVRNASVQLDPETLRPTYQLEMGLAGSSGGLEIAAQLKLSPVILKAARQQLSTQDLKVDSYLRQLRQELEKLRRQQQKLAQEQQRLAQRGRRLEEESRTRRREWELGLNEALDKLGVEFREEIRSYMTRLNNRFEIAKLKKEAIRKEALLKEAFRLRIRSQESAREGVGRTGGGLAPGDSVFLPLFQGIGRVLSVGAHNVTVDFRGKKVRLPLDQIQPAVPTEPAAKRIPANVVLDVSEGPGRELNIIGQTVEEALEQVDKFLDRAFVAHMPEVLIVHGFGTGRLKSAISRFVETHPHVRSFQVEGGATRIKLNL